MNSFQFTNLYLTKVKHVFSRPWICNIQYSTSIMKPTRRTRRGTKAGRNYFRPIRTRMTYDRNTHSDQGVNANHNNLIQLVDHQTNFNGVQQISALIKPRQIAQKRNQSIVDQGNLTKINRAPIESIKNTLSLVSMNVRSVKNKATSICDFVVSNKTDILAITETWLGTEIDKTVLSELVPDGYAIHHISRNGQKGGGVAIIYKSNIYLKLLKFDQCFTHFERLECCFKTKNQKVRVCVVYRPPPSRKNNFKNTIFFNEWSEYLDRLVVIPEEIIITGDLNFHLDNLNDSDARKMLDILADHNLIQHVQGATHNRGHTLDVVITRENSPILLDAPLIQDPCLCDVKGNPAGDHLALFSRLRISKPSFKRQTVNIRKYREIIMEDFISDLELSIDKPGCTLGTTVENMVAMYDQEI